MKLYCARAACSMASHIALLESGAAFEIDTVDTGGSRTTSDGRPYDEINPKGLVPALEYRPGRILTENVAVLQFIADRNPEAGLAPPPQSDARYRLQEWLGFINSDLHRAYTPLFRANTPHGSKVIQRLRIHAWLDYVEQVLARRSFLLQDSFSVADCYLFVVLSWSGAARVDLTNWRAISAYCDGLLARDTVRTVLLENGYDL